MDDKWDTGHLRMTRTSHFHQPQTGGNGKTPYETVFVARQPVFGRDLSTWGYALLYRDAGDADRAVFSDDFDATLRVVANAPLCPDTCAPDKHVLIHFPERSVIGGVAHALPPETTVVLVAELADPGPEYLDSLLGLKRDGYTLALDNYSAAPAREAQYALADIFCMDVLGRETRELSALARAAGKWPARLLAKRVEDQGTLELCRELGFHLFQGFFFKKPQTLSARTISSLEESRLRLFEVIEHEEPDFPALAQAIEADVSLTYRLLTFLNSASFGFAKKVASIRQAVVLAGWKPIRAWLRLLLLTDLVPAARTRELAYLSAQRARFLELAAQAGDRPDQADTLFLMGLFSLLEPIFNMPMEHIVDRLPLPEAVRLALCGEDNELSPWLALTQALENSDFSAARTLCRSLDLEPTQAAEAYQASLHWADCFFGLLAADPGGAEI